MNINKTIKLSKKWALHIYGWYWNFRNSIILGISYNKGHIFGKEDFKKYVIENNKIDKVLYGLDIHFFVLTINLNFVKKLEVKS